MLIMQIKGVVCVSFRHEQHSDADMIPRNKGTSRPENKTITNSIVLNIVNALNRGSGK